MPNEWCIHGVKSKWRRQVFLILFFFLVFTSWLWFWWSALKRQLKPMWILVGFYWIATTKLRGHLLSCTYECWCTCYLLTLVASHAVSRVYSISHNVTPFFSRRLLLFIDIFSTLSARYYKWVESARRSLTRRYQAINTYKVIKNKI